MGVVTNASSPFKGGASTWFYAKTNFRKRMKYLTAHVYHVHLKGTMPYDSEDNCVYKCAGVVPEAFGDDSCLPVS